MFRFTLNFLVNNLFLGFVTLGLLMIGGIANSQDEINTYQCLENENELETGTPKDYAYVQSATVWKNSENVPTDTIYVCWENPSENDANERKWVEEAILSTWGKESALTFEGWQECSQRNKGIRILINDSGPHTKGLGNQLDEKENGMVLNFTFQNWDVLVAEYSEEGEIIDFGTCVSSEGSPSWRKVCIENIAMHEFGHALGFTHEHNRPDRDECFKNGQIIPIDNFHLLDTQVLGNVENYAVIGEYDPESIMNYCHNIYVKDLDLSKLDKEGVQCIYGKPN